MFISSYYWQRGSVLRPRVPGQSEGPTVCRSPMEGKHSHTGQLTAWSVDFAFSRVLR